MSEWKQSNIDEVSVEEIEEAPTEVVPGSEVAKERETSVEEFDERYKEWMEEYQERIDSLKRQVSKGQVSTYGIMGYNWKEYYLKEPIELAEIAKKLGKDEDAKILKESSELLGVALNEYADACAVRNKEKYEGKDAFRCSPYTTAGVYEIIGNQEKAAEYNRLGKEYHAKKEEDRLASFRKGGKESLDKAA